MSTLVGEIPMRCASCGQRLFIAYLVSGVVEKECINEECERYGKTLTDSLEDSEM
jgi:hypothetical protein